MSYEPESEKLEEEIQWASQTAEKSLSMLSRVIVGQSHVCSRLLIAMIAGGHVLLEGLPGLAKTTAVKALADISDLDVQRIQFTPDMLPADVLGTEIYNPKTGEFSVKKGPVFTNLLIADEINRAPAKVQSALLEAMQECQVTLGDQTFKLTPPFLVMATQNPIEQEGTYPLPEAQMDRFLFKVKVGYGSHEDEQEIMKRMANPEKAELESTLSAEHIAKMQATAQKIHIADKIRKYIVDVVFATRGDLSGFPDSIAAMIEVGASPRASINLEITAKIWAMLQGRNFVTPQDVKDVGADILRHRIALNYEAEAQKIDQDHVISQIFNHVDVP
ncbi:MoxR family ATPase [Oligoflexaceae bacterium]|nr:MoxR family ATPase [Oligoflexaceae bacterium]